MPATNPTVAPPAAILTAEALLQGQLPLAESLSLSTHVRPDQGQGEAWSDWLFYPLEIVDDLTEADARNTLAKGVVETLEDEKAINATPLDQRGRELAGKMYDAACADALRELVELAEGRLGWSPRLRARLCVACRDELAELVAEWKALQLSAKGVA